MTKIPVFSPAQIAGGTFWGGPIAGTYLLRKNYLALDMNAEATRITVIGATISALIIFSVGYIPESVPNFLIPALYTVPAGILAETNHLPKEVIKTSDEYTFGSNWFLFWFGFVTLILSIALMAMGMIILEPPILQEST